MSVIADKAIECMREMHSKCRHHVAKFAAGLPLLINKMIDFAGDQQAQIDAQAAQIKELQMDIIQIRQWQRDDEESAADFLASKKAGNAGTPHDEKLHAAWPITGKRVLLGAAASEHFSPLAER